MANTVKAYKNYNGQIILDCGTLYGKPVQYVISDIGVIQVFGPAIVTDFTGMEEQYFDNFILSTLDNAMMYGNNGRKLTNDEITQLIVLVNEKIEDFDGPQ